jgi:transposase-like protein/IS1 family transposase
MIAHACNCEDYSKNGKSRKGEQRFRCKDCGRRWTETRIRPLDDMRIELDRAALAIQLLVEGSSIRSASRITKLSQDTISSLILTVGAKCNRFLAKTVTGVKCNFVEADEVWSFIGMKEKTRKAKGFSNEFGDSWTFVAIDRETKLVLAHHVADRSLEASYKFLEKLNEATTGRFQLTTDGWHGYTTAVPMTFGKRVDFAQLIKNYEKEQETIRYSPAKIRSIEKVPRFGNPDLEMCSTSFIENWNLQLRMSNRRHTRLTNAFSKSKTHHVAMQAIFIAAYNFCRRHGTLKTSPAVTIGLTDSIWSIDRLLGEIV